MFLKSDVKFLKPKRHGKVSRRSFNFVVGDFDLLLVTCKHHTFGMFGKTTETTASHEGLESEAKERFEKKTRKDLTRNVQIDLMLLIRGDRSCRSGSERIPTIYLIQQ